MRVTSQAHYGQRGSPLIRRLRRQITRRSHLIVGMRSLASATPRDKLRCFTLVAVSALCSIGCPQHKDIGVIRMVEPAYPAEARNNNIEGTVYLSIAIGMDGRVIGAS